LQTTVKIKARPNISHGRSAITSKFEQSALRTFLPRTGVKPITEDYIQNTKPTQFISQVPVIQTEPQQIYTIPSSSERILQPKYLPTVVRPEKVISQQPIMVEHPDVGYSTKPNVGDDINYSSQQYTTSPPIYSNYDLNSQKNVPYSSNMARTDKNVPYTSTQYENNPDVPYTSSKMGKIDGGKNVSYTSYGRKDANYSSYGRKDEPYSSYGRKDANYSSYGRKDEAYSSRRMGGLDVNKNVAYTSTQINQKDAPYTSTQLGQKGPSYSSQMSTGSNNAGYSSQMAKNIGDSTNEGYSSQMGKAAEKYIQGNSSKRYKGSRAPNVSYSSKTQGNKSSDGGYTSFK
jgi:hypothetical protein